MKISNEGIPPERRTNAVAPANSATTEFTPGQSTPQDSIEVGDASRLLARLHEESSAKIAELRAKVAGGNYAIEASDVSQKLVDSMLTK